MKKLDIIRENSLYRSFINLIFYPIFNIFWEYIINLEAKFLYFYWKLKNNHKDTFELGKNDSILIKNNFEFNNISKEISENLSENIIKIKNKLLSEEFKKECINKFGENHTDAILPYRISVWEYLDKNIRKKILQFASSTKMISTAANHMKIFPILTRVQVYYNIPRENSDLRGAMYWHKDTLGFKNLDFFMYISDVDENSGPFYFLKKQIKGSVFMHFKKMRPFNLSGERGKVDISEFSKYFPENDVEKMIGKSGTAAFLDSFSTFHRGGFCKSKDRIVLRFCYQSHDASYETQVSNQKEYKFDNDLTYKNTKNLFYRYLFFKEKSKLMKYFSSMLLKVYWRLRYYVS